jgi:hypothetical protein
MGSTRVRMADVREAPRQPPLATSFLLGMRVRWVRQRCRSGWSVL